MSGSNNPNGSVVQAYPQHEHFIQSTIPRATIDKLKAVIDVLNAEHGYHIKKLGKKAELVEKVSNAFEGFRTEHRPDGYRSARAAFDKIMAGGKWEGWNPATTTTSLPARPVTSSGGGYGHGHVGSSASPGVGMGGQNGHGQGQGGYGHNAVASGSGSGGAAGRAYSGMPNYQGGVGRTGYGYSASPSPAPGGAASYRPGGAAQVNGTLYGGNGNAPINVLPPWKETPGWKAVMALTEMQMLPAVDEHHPQEKKSRAIAFKITAEVASQLAGQTGYASHGRPTRSIRMFSTSSDYYPNLGRGGLLPLEFPVNGDCTINQYPIEMKKGAKVAGTVGPLLLDKPIGHGMALKKSAGTTNMLNVTATGPSMNKKTKISKKFWFQVVLTETQTAAEIKSKVMAGPRKTLEQVKAGMQATADGDDIEMGAYKLSLKDPNVFSRIQIPVRSTLCSHLQCFDLELWISLNEQTPKWTCPTCEKDLRLDQLFIDGYSEAVLKACPDSIDDVLVEPDGEWHSENGKYGTESWIAAHPPMSARASASMTNTPAGSRKNSPALFGNSGHNNGQSSSGLNNEIVMLDDDSEDDDEDMPLAALGNGGANSSNMTPGEDAESIIDLCSDDDDDQPLAHKAQREEPAWAKRLGSYGVDFGETVLGKRERMDEFSDDEDMPIGRPASQRRRVLQSPDFAGRNAVASSSGAVPTGRNAAASIGHADGQADDAIGGIVNDDQLLPGSRAGNNNESSASMASSIPLPPLGRIPKITIRFNRDGPPAASGATMTAQRNDRAISSPLTSPESSGWRGPTPALMTASSNEHAKTNTSASTLQEAGVPSPRESRGTSPSIPLWGQKATFPTDRPREAVPISHRGASPLSVFRGVSAEETEQRFAALPAGDATDDIFPRARARWASPMTESSSLTSDPGSETGGLMTSPLPVALANMAGSAPPLGNDLPDRQAEAPKRTLEGADDEERDMDMETDSQSHSEVVNARHHEAAPVSSARSDEAFFDAMTSPTGSEPSSKQTRPDATEGQPRGGQWHDSGVAGERGEARGAASQRRSSPGSSFDYDNWSD